MTKKAISVTLRPENLRWLRGQTYATGRRSVSETLDELVSEVRVGGHGASKAVKSVVGSIRIGKSDPGLAEADSAIRRLFSPSATARSSRRREPSRG